MAVTDSGDLHSYLDGWDLAVDIRSVGGIGTPPRIRMVGIKHGLIGRLELSLPTWPSVLGWLSSMIPLVGIV